MYLQQIKQNQENIPYLHSSTDLLNNKLEISNMEWERDIQKHLLIIVVECNRIMNRKEVYAFLQRNILIIEAPILIGLNRPLRAHLVDREIRNECEKGVTDIRFSEVRLDKQYDYSLISFKVIKPGLLKVVLHYQKN